jgi:undecaprenyl-diphosphatase
MTATELRITVSMIEYLNIADKKLFMLINSGLSNPVFDALLPFLTDIHKQTAVLVAAGLLILWLAIKGGHRERMFVLVLIATIIVGDQLNSTLVKFLFEKPRPCHVINNIRLLVGCGSGYSFPSSHAVNNFAGAIVLTFFYPRGRILYFFYAALIAFSRIYVGVHYPSDVICGSVLGMTCAGCVIALFIYSEKFIRHYDDSGSAGRSHI